MPRLTFLSICREETARRGPAASVLGQGLHTSDSGGHGFLSPPSASAWGEDSSDARGAAGLKVEGAVLFRRETYDSCPPGLARQSVRRFGGPKRCTHSDRGLASGRAPSQSLRPGTELTGHPRHQQNPEEEAFGQNQNRDVHLGQESHRCLERKEQT